MGSARCEVRRGLGEEDHWQSDRIMPSKQEKPKHSPSPLPPEDLSSSLGSAIDLEILAKPSPFLGFHFLPFKMKAL